VEVVQRALGLRAPQAVGRDFDRAETVFLDPVVHVGSCFFISEAGAKECSRNPLITLRLQILQIHGAAPSFLLSACSLPAPPRRVHAAELGDAQVLSHIGQRWSPTSS
jgi:hypothetical protein